MANREAPASRRATIVSPDSLMVGELEPLVQSHLDGTLLHRLPNYPSPREVSTILGGGGAQVVFLDVTSDRDQALPLLEEMARLGPHVQVIVLMAQNDPDMILRCLRSGAIDFLMRPFTTDQAEAAFGKIARVQTATESVAKDPAKIFAVMPAKGACGASTIACNLAYQWKRLGAKKILLVDLDPLTGNISFLLKIKSVYSFLDTLQRSHELDDDLWGAMVTKVGGVDVLLAPDLMLEGASELRDPSPILEYARHNYDVVVLDAASVYGDWNLNIARTAAELLLVTTNELPALQAAQRAMSYLETNRIGRWKVRLIVNRYMKDVGLSREVIGTALHTEVFETLPSDPEAIQKALLEGKSVASSTNLGKAFVHLADHFGQAKKQSEGKSSSGLSGLFGGLFAKKK
jgi:pilus assembly protein CpaE